mgnify:CR=1 FL=1
MSTVGVAIDTPARLGECPVCSELDQALHWTDIEACVVHRFDPVSGMDDTRGLPGRVGTIAMTDQPGVLVLAIENALFEVDGTGNRSNDGCVDPAGRFVLGTMYEDAAAGRATGSLYRVDEQVTALRTGIGIPNGLAFDAQRGLVYWADTFTARIIVADYDATDGTWHDERTFFNYADAPGRPDGACLNTEGGYWSASVTGWCVTRIDPDGTVTDRIDVPLEKPSMPAFGGDDHKTLFVTTIGDKHGRPATPGRDGVRPGSLLAIEGTGATGIAETPFGFSKQATSSG